MTSLQLEILRKEKFRTKTRAEIKDQMRSRISSTCREIKLSIRKLASKGRRQRVNRIQGGFNTYVYSSSFILQ